MFMFDGKTGDDFGELCEEEDKNHKGGIVAIHFPEDNTLISASSDKTIKIWNLKEKKAICTLLPVEETHLNDFQHMQTAVSEFGGNIVSVSLNGKINIWKKENVQDKASPDIVINGHKVRKPR